MRAGLCAQRFADMLKTEFAELGIGGAQPSILRSHIGEFLHVAAVPRIQVSPERRKSDAQVDLHRRVRIGPRGVVDDDRFIRNRGLPPFIDLVGVRVISRMGTRTPPGCLPSTKILREAGNGVVER